MSDYDAYYKEHLDTIEKCKENMNKSIPSTRDFNKAIGERLKSLRLQRGFSRQDVSDLIGLGVDRYSNYERGASVEAYRIAQFVAIYNVSADYIFGYTNSPR